MGKRINTIEIKTFSEKLERIIQSKELLESEMFRFKELLEKTKFYESLIKDLKTSTNQNLIAIKALFILGFTCGALMERPEAFQMFLDHYSSEKK